MKYINPADAIVALEQTSGKLDKQAICEEALLQNPDFHTGANYAYDPFITFGVRKAPTATEDGPGLPFAKFAALAEELRLRRLTGHAARDTIAEHMAEATAHQWNNWYRRILLRDFRAGVTDSTINKAINKVGTFAEIKTYSCQLAFPSKKQPKKMKGKKWLETKYDGARLNIVVFPDGEVLVLSREGRPIVNFPHLAEQFSKTASWHDEPMMYDGEVVSGQFYSMMKSFKKKTVQVVANDATFIMFDRCPWSVVETGGTYKVKQRQRRADLQAWFDEHAEMLPDLDVIEHTEVDLDTEEGRKAASLFNLKMTELAKIDPKVEGVMYKDPDEFYYTKRHAAWLKEKPFITVTLEITGYYAGDEGKKFGEALGGFECKGFDLDHHIEVNCGGGYTPDMRDEFWENREKCIGRLIEIEADGFTPPRADGTVSLRFPVYKCFRDTAERPGEII